MSMRIDNPKSSVVQSFGRAKAQWSESSVARDFDGLKIRWSGSTVVRMFSSPKVLWLKVQWLKVQWSEGSVVRRITQYNICTSKTI